MIVAVSQTIVFGQRRFAPARRRPSGRQRRSSPPPRRSSLAKDGLLRPGDDLLADSDDRRRLPDDRLWPKTVCSGPATTFWQTAMIVAVSQTIVFGQRRFAPARRRPSGSQRRSSPPP